MKVGGIRRIALGSLAGAVGTLLMVSTTGGPASAAVAAASTGWGNPVFEDDFTGPTLDPKSWYTYDNPDDDTKAPRRSSSLLQVRDGELQLLGTVNARNEEIGAGLEQAAHLKYGRWEARFRVDAGAGYGAAILLWPDGTWPDDGEIDAIEIPRADRQSGQNTVHNTPANIPADNPVDRDFTKWTTLAVDWLPDHVTFWVDGVAVWTLTDKKLIPSGSTMHLALQLDECAPKVYGSAWIACRDTSTPFPPVVMHVDWTKIYKWSGQAVPAPTPVKTPTGPGTPGPTTGVGAGTPVGTTPVGTPTGGAGSAGGTPTAPPAVPIRANPHFTG